jgi:hypothetical protein
MSSSVRAFRASSLEDFSSQYKQFKSVPEDYPELWALLNSDEAFQKMRWATLDLNLPAVAGVAKECEQHIKGVPARRRDWVKKAIGAMVCTVMKENGFKKANRKKAVPPMPKRIFRVGEVYELEK